MLALLQLLAQVGETAPAVAETAAKESKHLIHLVMEADPVVQLTLVILFVFSIISWAIILAKHTQIKKYTQGIRQFDIDALPAKGTDRKNPGLKLYRAAHNAKKKNLI